LRSGRVRLMDTMLNHPEYNPWQRILKAPDKAWKYRYLVGVD
jgi:hypothetical protein